MRRNLRRRYRNPKEPAARATILTVAHAVVSDFDHGSSWVDEEALGSHMVRWYGVRLAVWTCSLVAGGESDFQ